MKIARLVTRKFLIKQLKMVVQKNLLCVRKSTMQYMHTLLTNAVLMVVLT